MPSDNGSSSTDEFYQGYSQTIPPQIRRFLLIVIPLIAVVVVVLSVVLPSIHKLPVFINLKSPLSTPFLKLLICRPRLSTLRGRI